MVVSGRERLISDPSIGLRSLDKLSTSSSNNKTSPSVMKMYNLRELGKVMNEDPCWRR